jgi:hypothetical protein
MGSLPAPSVAAAGFAAWAERSQRKDRQQEPAVEADRSLKAMRPLGCARF